MAINEGYRDYLLEQLDAESHRSGGEREAG
jgi:hypothetical protein